MPTEAQTQSHILRALGSRPDVRLFRNHVGSGWSGPSVRSNDGSVTIKPARRVNFGLAKGSADLVGWRTVSIQDLIEAGWSEVAVFLSLEIKSPSGRASKEQLAWDRTVERMHGMSGIVRSVEEALGVVEVGG